MWEWDKWHALGMKAKRQHKSLEEKDRIVAGYHRSGLTQSVYARQVGMGLSTLSLWIRQRSKTEPVTWLEIKRPQAARANSLQVTLPSGIRVDIQPGFETLEVKRLLSAVRELF